MSAERLNRDKVRMEAEKEMEEENIVNRLQRQIEGLILNYKVHPHTAAYSWFQ